MGRERCILAASDAQGNAEQSPVIVIGGGIAGLAAAWKLARAGKKIRLIEKDRRLGGVIRSLRKDGFLIEEGPNTVQNHSDELGEMRRALGLEDRLLFATGTEKKYLVRFGRVHPVPTGVLSSVTSPLLSLRGKVRLAVEPWVKPFPLAGVSAEEFIRRRIGREGYERLFEPVVAGIYAGDPREMEMRYAFPKLTALVENSGSLIRGAVERMRRARRDRALQKRQKRQAMIFSFPEGLEELPRAVEKFLGDRLLLGTRARKIEPIDHGFRLTLEKGDGMKEQVFGSDVVLAVPAHALSGIEMPPEVRKACEVLAGAPYAPVGIAALGYKDQGPLRRLEGFGVLVPAVERRSILGVLFSSSLFPERAPRGMRLLTIFYGGRRNPEMVLDEKEFPREAILRDLQEIFGIEEEPLFEHWIRYPKAIAQYLLGHGRILKAQERLEARCPGLLLAGSYLTGASVPATADSGFRAAEKILSR